MRHLIALATILMCATAYSQHFYDPDRPGHGITVQSVGDGYALQWYAHCGAYNQCWLVSDVGGWGEPNDLFAATGSRWPASSTRLRHVGTVTAVRHEQELLVEYSIALPEVWCHDLPGPRPAQCGYEEAQLLRPGFEASGVFGMTILAE